MKKHSQQNLAKKNAARDKAYKKKLERRKAKKENISDTDKRVPGKEPYKFINERPKQVQKK